MIYTGLLLLLCFKITDILYNHTGGNSKKTTWPRTLQCARRVGQLFSVMRGEQSDNVK